MNAHDSERIAGWLEECGYQSTDSTEEADLILFNTCCVREGAERRVYGNVGALKELKQRKPDCILAVCGCMMQQAGAAEKLTRRFPFVDLAFGTNHLHEFPVLLLRAIEAGGAVLAVAQEDGRISENLPQRRALGPTAYLTIMYGCNNFCSYCIVPYVRGRERSRDVADIQREAEALLEAGTREITLLGQNVNSYGVDSGGLRFPELLRTLDAMGFTRIRFMTSHPKDASDALFETMARGRSICPQLHLPVQSGSDAILRAMNRGYDRAHYFERIQKARALLPDLGVSTDFIVGFPGETNADFEATLELSRRVSFDSAYMFRYSPRRGTKAAELPERIAPEIVSERLSRLIALQAEETHKHLQAKVGSEQAVLVESASAQSGQVAGRIASGLSINIDGDAADIGKYLRVVVTEAKRNTLRGQRM